RVVRGHDRSTGITEDDFDPLTNQDVPDALRASELLRAGHGLEALWSLGDRVGQGCGHGISPRGCLGGGEATLKSAFGLEVYRRWWVKSKKPPDLLGAGAEVLLSQY